MNPVRPLLHLQRQLAREAREVPPLPCGAQVSGGRAAHSLRGHEAGPLRATLEPPGVGALSQTVLPPGAERRAAAASKRAMPSREGRGAGGPLASAGPTHSACPVLGKGSRGQAAPAHLSCPGGLRALGQGGQQGGAAPRRRGQAGEVSLRHAARPHHTWSPGQPRSSPRGQASGALAGMSACSCVIFRRLDALQLHAPCLPSLPTCTHLLPLRPLFVLAIPDLFLFLPLRLFLLPLLVLVLVLHFLPLLLLIVFLLVLLLLSPLMPRPHGNLHLAQQGIPVRHRVHVGGLEAQAQAQVHVQVHIRLQLRRTLPQAPQASPTPSPAGLPPSAASPHALAPHAPNAFAWPSRCQPPPGWAGPLQS